MLVLVRRRGEAIHIGDDITVKVVETGSQVRIGIDAPGDIRVDRSEVREAREATADELVEVGFIENDSPRDIAFHMLEPGEERRRFWTYVEVPKAQAERWKQIENAFYDARQQWAALYEEVLDAELVAKGLQ